MKPCSLQTQSGDFTQVVKRTPLAARHAAAVATILSLIIAAHASWAGSATWSSTPGSSDWNTASNWIPPMVPNGAADTATFSNSNQTSVSISENIEVDAISFEPGAGAFTISNVADQDLTISGMGIVNNSAVEQNFMVGAPDNSTLISFRGTATAGALTRFTVNAGNQSGGQGGHVWFLENSSAGHGTFITKGSPISGGSVFGGGYGYVEFFDQSSAGEGNFINEGSVFSNSPGGATFIYAAFAGSGIFTNNAGTVAGAGGGVTQVTTTGSAENGTFVNNGGAIAGAGGGTTIFLDRATAADAILIANGGVSGAEGGSIIFEGLSDGGAAQCRLFGNGTLDVQYDGPVVTIGSLEGDGQALIGSTTLIVGSNNLSTTFSGTFLGDGALEKVGTGTLTLSGVSEFFVGPKTVTQGTLQASKDGVLGTGDVTVNAGATLELQGGANNDDVANAATLHLIDGSIVSLDFSGAAETVVGLTINGVPQSDGVYGSAASGAAHQLPQFTGTGTLLVAPLPTIQFLNVSTRLQVLTGDNVLIGGFIVAGNEPKQVVVRGIGPSLQDVGITGALSDPVLELHDSSGNIIATNDNWRDGQAAAIEAAGLAPTNDNESAILQTLDPGAYTAILRGVNDSTGIGLVEVYDLDQTVDSYLANISTRGFVQTGDNVMIGGTILGPSDGAGFVGIVVRALGPSLEALGVTNALQDPVLTAYDANGTGILTNDDWQSGGVPGFDPSDSRESAMQLFLTPGNYTAIVTGKDDDTGVALIEFYNLH